MRFEPTPLSGVVVIRPEPVADARGSFARSFCTEEFAGAGLPFQVVQANVSRNVHRHTLRGLHFQRTPHGEPKIVSCTKGRIWDVAVDLRRDSPTFRRWFGIELAPDDGTALFIDTGLAHGFLTLEPDSDVHYLMGAPFVSGSGDGVRWDDPMIGVAWPAPPAVISERDRAYPPLTG